MRILSILIWAFFISDALSQGLSVPYSTFGQDIPIKFAPIIILFPFLFFSLTPFLQRKNTEENLFTKTVKKIFGTEATNRFIKELRFYWLLTAFCLTLGISGVASTYLSTQSLSGYLISGYFISGGFGLIVSYLLSVKSPPKVA
jgi:hypothetical protein